MWHASFLAAVDDWHVGIRTDDQDVADQLQLLLGDILVESANPPSGYAVVARPRATGTRSRPLAEMRHGPQVLLRSRYPGRLAAAAAAHVLALGHARQPVLRLTYSLVARDYAGILVPPRLLRIPGLEPLLVQAGWSITDAPEIAVTGHDVQATTVVSWSGVRSGPTTDQVTLRYVVVPDNEIGQRTSRSTVLAHLMESSPPSALAPQEHLDLAARLAQQLLVVSVTGTGPQAVATALERAL